MEQEQKQRLIMKFNNSVEQLKADFARQLETDAKIRCIEYTVSVNASRSGIDIVLSKSTEKPLFVEYLGHMMTNATAD